MKTRLLSLSCAALAASIMLGGTYQFTWAQSDERADKVEMKKQLAKDRREERTKRKKSKKKNGPNISKHKGPLEIALPACCDGSCAEDQNLSVFYAGNADGFDTSDGAEMTSPSAALQGYMDTYNNGQFPNRQFDDQNSNRVFGHTFTKLPADITCATLEIGLKARPDIPSNDWVNLNFDGNKSFAWSIRFENTPEANGTWNNGQTAVIKLDLADLIASPSNGATEVISSINVKNLLDVHIQDDTAVDYIVLTVVTYDGAWTSWLDRDKPSGQGDYETVKDFIKEGTLPREPAPVCIQCRTLDGVDWQDAGQNYHCELPLGGYCVNAENGGKCLDYEVRFLYPE